MSAPHLVEHFFRHEYGRLVATLCRRVGVQRLALVEDAVQAALMAAFERWTGSGLPERPSAWLFRVAHHHVLTELRRSARQEAILARTFAQTEERAAWAREDAAEPAFATEVQDDLLRMLFVCCDQAIPESSQLVMALKVLCGFDVQEIAHRLFLTKANVYKRLGRAREALRAHGPRLDELSDDQYGARLATVHKVLYLLFTEGYLSSRPETAIRQELCDEALRLTSVLVEHPVGRTPETCALLALMHLHRARLGARLDDDGELLLLADQDRSLWDTRQIRVGLRWLARSARGDSYSRYHAEAAIAAEHCLAPSLAETRWDRIVECYDLLERFAPSPLHRLGRALAVAEWQGPAAGLAALEGLEPPSWLAGSHLWAAALADLHRRCGNTRAAANHREAALRLAPSDAVRQLLQRRLGN